MKSNNQVNKKPLGLRRSNFGISIILFLVFLFGLSSIIYTDSYKATLEEQRKSIYGSWHVAVYDTTEEVYQSLKGHGTVKSVGYMEMVGYAVSPLSHDETEILGGVGYADENLIDMGNIKLLDGRLPSTEGEIAVEASYLNRMGYSYELGQQITISISCEDNNGEHIGTTHNFKLCGVVKNYSAYWKTDGYWLTSFFVFPQLFDEVSNSQLYTFAEIEPEFAVGADSLSIISLNQGYFTKNEFTYLQYSKQNDPILNLKIQQIIIVLASFLFIFILMNTDIRQRYNSFITMRILGATKGQIIWVFLKEKMKLIFISSGLGIICGIVLPYLIFRLISKIFSEPVTYYFNMLNSILIIVILYGGLIISLALSLITLFQIPLRGIPGQQAAIKKPRRGRNKLGVNNLFSVFHVADGRQRLLSIGLTFIAVLFIYILAYETWDIYKIYSQYEIDYPEDYSFGVLASNAPPRVTMSEESLEQIRLAYGVGEVQTVSVSEYYGLSFSSAYDKQYADQIHKYLLEDVGELPNTQICGSFIGVSDNLLSIYTDEIDAGFIHDKLRDDEVILYLPGYYKQEDGSLLAQEDLRMPGAQILSEGTIAVGDHVQVDMGGRIKNLKIAGIIYSFDDQTPFSYNPMRPYSLICNQNTYKQVLGYRDYAYVLVYNDRKTIPYQTDVELSKIQTELFFNNKRVERSEQSQNLMLQMILALLLSTSVFLVTTIIRFATYSFNEKQKRERYKLLYQLGMSKLTMLKNMVRNASFNSLLGCGLAVFVFLGFYLVQEGRNLLTYDDYVKPDTLDFICDILIRYIPYMEWEFMTILFVGLSILNFLIVFIHDYGYLYKGRYF